MKVSGKKVKVDGIAAMRYYEDDVAFVGFLNDDTNEFVPVMRIRSDKDIEKFMKKYHVLTIIKLQGGM